VQTETKVQKQKLHHITRPAVCSGVRFDNSWSGRGGGAAMAMQLPKRRGGARNDAKENR
jgi:hypothetical protein